MEDNQLKATLWLGMKPNISVFKLGYALIVFSRFDELIQLINSERRFFYKELEHNPSLIFHLIREEERLNISSIKYGSPFELNIIGNREVIELLIAFLLLINDITDKNKNGIINRCVELIRSRYNVHIDAFMHEIKDIITNIFNIDTKYVDTHLNENDEMEIRELVKKLRERDQDKGKNDE